MRYMTLGHISHTRELPESFKIMSIPLKSPNITLRVYLDCYYFLDSSSWPHLSPVDRQTDRPTAKQNNWSCYNYHKQKVILDSEQKELPLTHHTYNDWNRTTTTTTDTVWKKVTPLTVPNTASPRSQTSKQRCLPKSQKAIPVLVLLWRRT